MGSILGYRDVKNQSNAVFNQFGESKWIPYAKINATLPRRNANELKHCGLGKVLVLAAMGESLEDAIPTLLKYRNRFDIVACDKAFGRLLDAGIKADFVQLADCNIDFKWIAKYIPQTADVKLLSTCYGNIEWTKAWLGPRYFYLNRDAISTETKFTPIMGADSRSIPASSNVSNAMVVFMLGVDEFSQSNWAGYEEYMLVGYDYSWRPDSSEFVGKSGKYYAFEDPKPKRYYMQHRTLLDFNGDICHSSENLLFSAKWLYSYVTCYNLPVINCSGRGIMDIPLRATLESRLEKINPDRHIPGMVRANVNVLSQAHKAYKEAEAAFNASRRMIYGSW